MVVGVVNPNGSAFDGVELIFVKPKGGVEKMLLAMMQNLKYQRIKSVLKSSLFVELQFYCCHDA